LCRDRVLLYITDLNVKLIIINKVAKTGYFTIKENTFEKRKCKPKEREKK